MRKAVLIALAIFVTGCDSARISGSDPEVSSTTPAAFHLRDFNIKEETNEYTITYKGRMTLVATSEQLKTGKYLVLVEAQAEHETDPKFITSALLVDGLGEITTYDSQSKDEPKQRPKYTNWRIMGYQPIHPGTVTSDGSVSVAAPVIN